MNRCMFGKNDEGRNMFNSIINKICHVAYKEYKEGDIASFSYAGKENSNESNFIEDIFRTSTGDSRDDVVNSINGKICDAEYANFNEDKTDTFDFTQEFPYIRKKSESVSLLSNENQNAKIYLLAICVSGKAKFKIDNGTYCFEKETCALFSDGELKNFEILQPASFVFIHLSGPDIDLLYSCNNGRYFHKILNIGNSVGFYKLLSKTFAGKWDSASVIQNSSFIYEALLEFVKVEYDGGKSLSREFTEYVEKNICSRIFISQVAKQLLVSESKLTKVIRREMGVSPYSYILETKLKISERDLIEGRSTIAEIAARYGFDSCAAYVTAFKKKRKMSPSAFRENWITNCMKLNMLKI